MHCRGISHLLNVAGATNIIFKFMNDPLWACAVLRVEPSVGDQRVENFKFTCEISKSPNKVVPQRYLLLLRLRSLSRRQSVSIHEIASVGILHLNYKQTFGIVPTKYQSAMLESTSLDPAHPPNADPTALALFPQYASTQSSLFQFDLRKYSATMKPTFRCPALLREELDSDQVARLL